MLLLGHHLLMIICKIQARVRNVYSMAEGFPLAEPDHLFGLCPDKQQSQSPLLFVRRDKLC